MSLRPPSPLPRCVARSAATASIAAVVLAAAGGTASAQGPPPADSVRHLAAAPAAPAAGATAGATAGPAATAALILAGAAGTQLLRTPDAWPRTAAGFGRRAADQAGFYVLQTGGQRLLARAVSARLGWRPDTARCAARARGLLAACAVRQTFTLADADGRRRPHVPLLASVGAATAASVAWRPERRDGGRAAAFAATRVAVVLGGYAAERLLVDWWAGRRGAHR